MQQIAVYQDDAEKLKNLAEKFNVEEADIIEAMLSIVSEDDLEFELK